MSCRSINDGAAQICAASRRQYDLLAMIEPDAMTRSTRSKIFVFLCAIKAALRIGLYGNTQLSYGAREAHETLMGLPPIWEDWLMPDTSKPYPDLPRHTRWNRNRCPVPPRLPR